MAAIDYGAAVGPKKKIGRSIKFIDGTGSPVELACADWDGELSYASAEQSSTSYKPNDQRPSGGAMVLNVGDQEEDFTLAIGAKSWVGSTVHTPLEFARGETVNSVALTSVGSAGKFLFIVEITEDSTSDGGGSQTITRGKVELLSVGSETRDGITFLLLNCRNHENKPTVA